ncbi:SRPBCC family protein [Cytophagaceae bacterium ABcell3]|nr:SRPBCC family protein [Cytophagaceae bacterium ABcell3]
MSESREKAVAGVTSGLIKGGEEVTWEATHLGVRQRLTSRIEIFSPPFHFRDVMVKGFFKTLKHDHFFEKAPEGTIMKDVFYFESPFGWAGKLLDKLFLATYLRKLLLLRNEHVKASAEEMLSADIK